MDKFDLLATEAQLCVCLLANADVSDVEYVSLMSVPSPEDIFQDDVFRSYRDRGLVFIGAIGIVNGAPRTALDVPLDHIRMAAISMGFARYCEALMDGHLEQQAKGDEVDWLRRLYALEDTRNT